MGIGNLAKFLGYRSNESWLLEEWHNNEFLKSEKNFIAFETENLETGAW